MKRMPRKHTQPFGTKYVVTMMVMGLVSVGVSFGLGIESAGDVETVTPLSAAETFVQPGDVDYDGVVTIQDAIVILEIANGYRTAEAFELRADPNEDGRLTVDDAISILHDVPVR